MKRVKYLFLFLLLIGACAGFAACSDRPEELAAPTNLAISDDEILTWDRVEGASSYIVEIDDKDYETETNSLDIFELTAEYKTFGIRVIACGDSSDIWESKPSERLEYAVEAPYEKDETRANGQVLLKSGIGLSLTDDGAAYAVFARTAKAKGKAIIPSEYDWKPVVEICKGAFNKNETITGVILPNSVETIIRESFSDCYNLKRVRLPKGLEMLPDYAFGNCKNLTKITLPDSLTVIGSAFNGCTSLKEITIPASVKSFASYGEDSNPFNACSGLERIVMEENDYYKTDGNCLIRKPDRTVISGCKTSVIPEYAEAIGRCAFAGQEGLTHVMLPSSVTSIGPIAFRNCKNLEKITAAEGVYKSEGNCLIRKEDNTLVLGCKASVIPAYVEKIGDGAFYGSGIERIQIPANVKIIGEEAFSNCSALMEIEFPQGLETIGYKAFSNCIALAEIRFPQGLKTIGTGAFSNCIALTEIEFPQGLKTIGKMAFYNCAALTEIEFPEGLKRIDISAFAFCDSLYAVSFPASLEYLDEGAFSSPDGRFVVKLKSITLEEGDVYKLEKVTIEAIGLEYNKIVCKENNKVVLREEGRIGN